MAYDLSKLLVVGISSTALFDLQEEDRIFRSEGLQEFLDYQRKHEGVILGPGSAFPLIKGLLGLNDVLKERKVEVILMSRNSPDVSLRVFNSIHRHELKITRAALTGGAPLGPYLAPFEIGLFLSQNREDVQSAANQGVAAGLVYSPPQAHIPAGQIRIAFDGDCVIFSDEAQKIYDEQGLEAFYEHERENARKGLPAGPFARLLRTLSQAQGRNPEKSPIRVALDTDRNMPAHERVILTLRAWDVRIDEAFFLGGIAKTEIVKAFGAHMFFDDKEEHCRSAAQKVPTGQVLLPLTPQPVPGLQSDIEVTVRLEAEESIPGQERFLTICKGHLKHGFLSSEPSLREWYGKTRYWPDTNRSALLRELEESVEGTPRGAERRAVGEEDTSAAKLIAFLSDLALKHRPE